jgi:hypothetical protein
MQDLLKEAIADAKAVKETAIANAKLALEEAFTPRIQSMISSRLEEEEMEDEEMSIEEPGMEDSGMDVGDLSIDVDGDGQFDEFDIMSKAAAAEDAAAMEMPAGEEELDEYDLSEILRQLDEEEMEDGMHDMEEGMSRSEVDAEEEEHLTDLEEEVDIDALLEELMADEEMDEMYNEHPMSTKDALEKEEMMEMKKMKKDNAKMKKELEEAYNAIATMRDSLNEVNMLNAKLLFTNKLFKAHNLNEGQKVKVIDTFDRARTIREVKLVYATLSESFSSKKTLVKESVASKPVASTKPTKIILSESEQIANRFKKLAGLNK